MKLFGIRRPGRTAGGRRLRAVLATAMASTLGIGLTASPAFALPEYQKCSNTYISDVCLTISPLGYGKYRVRFGIDLKRFTKTEAQALLDNSALYLPVVKGEDLGNDDTLFGIPFTRRAATDSGLTADAEIIVPTSKLDEDSEPSPFSTAGARDEVYAWISLRDFRTGAYLTYRTPTINFYAY